MRMTCEDFERGWQERFDSRSEPDLVRDQRLDEHAAGCTSCAESALRYRALAAALKSWGPPPRVPEGFAARVLAAHQADQRRVVRFPYPHTGRWAAAAAVLLVAALSFRYWTAPAPEVVTEPPRFDPRPLSSALADVTLATLDLARETSAPAARLGRHVLATVVEGEGPSLTLPGPLEAPGEVLQTVGQGVNQGVRPISGSARRAFGFLLGPSPRPRPAPDRDRDA